MAVSTYYFDGHNGISDPNGVWTNDSNAFDGSTSTYAVPGGSSGDDGTNNSLRGVGTNASLLSSTITQVRARVFGRSSGLSVHATIYHSSDYLGDVEYSGITANWGSYGILSAPTGGWTWEKIQDLSVWIYESDASALSSSRAYKVEIEVSSYTNDTGWISPGTAVNDTSFGSFSWSDPANVLASDDSYAYYYFGSDMDYGFAFTDKRVRIVKSDGSIGLTDKALGTAWNSSDTTSTYGGYSDRWGETWSASDINDVDFGVVISAYETGYGLDDTTRYLKATNFGFSIPTGSTIDGIEVAIEKSTHWDAGLGRFYARIDHIKIKVYYTEPDGTTDISDRGIYLVSDADDQSDRGLFVNSKDTLSSDRTLHLLGGINVDAERLLEATGGDGWYQEPFDTTTFKDTVNTTALWTGDGTVTMQ
jgi:hypothetical protein